jgi:hypothetical protein
MKWLSLLAVFLALQAGPAISLSPDSGQPGTQIKVAGSNFVPGERVKVLWDGSNLGGTVKVEANGGFSYTTAVPEGASPGAHTIEAVAVGGGTGAARAVFSVAAPPTPTTTTPTVASTTATPTTSPSNVAQPTATTAATSGGAAKAPSPTTATEPAAVATSPEEGGEEPVQETPETTTTVSGVVEPVADEVDDEPGSPAAAEPASPSRATEGRGGTGVLILALVLIGGVAGTFFFLWGRSRKEPVDPEAPIDPPEANTPALTALTAADVDLARAEWTRTMMELEPPGEVSATLGTPSGFLGVGWAGDGDRPDDAVIWNSVDGVKWEGVKILGNYGAMLIVPWRGGVVLTASNQDEPGSAPTCWFSEDCENWTLLTDGSNGALAGVSFEGAVDFRDALFAWGRAPAHRGVWVSEDGARWTPSSLQGEFDLIAKTEGGLLAFGRGKDRRPLLARSSGGDAWELSSQDARLREVAVASVQSFQNGLVMGGFDFAMGVGAVWVSDNGEAWSRVPFRPPTGTSIDHLAVVGDRLLAVGTDTRRRRGGRGTAVVWESEDATSWERITDSDLFSNSIANAVATGGQSALLCGAVFDDRDGAGGGPIPVSWKWSPLETPARESEPDGENPVSGTERDLEAVGGRSPMGL